MARRSRRRVRHPRPYSVIGAVIVINAKLAYSLFLGAIAWFIWPPSLEWWGFGFLAIILGVAAISFAGKTLVEAGQLILRDRATRRFERLGADPQTAELTSTEDLRRAGMLDG